MAETHDTIKSLLAEFRGYAAGMPPSYNVTMSVADIRLMLNRFEAAHGHDVDIATDAMSRSVVGACVKLQEAERKCVALHEAVKAALSAPPRNCDKVKTSWDVLKKWHEGLDTANDIVRMLDWLLAPAAENEGGAK